MPGTGPTTGSPSGVWARRPDHDASTGTSSRAGDTRAARSARRRIVSGPSGSSRSERRSDVPMRQRPPGRPPSRSETIPGSSVAPSATSRTVGAPTTLAISSCTGQSACSMAYGGDGSTRPVSKSQPRDDVMGRSTPSERRSMRSQGPVARTTRSQRRTPSSVARPVTRPPSTRTRLASHPRRNSTPSRRAASARAAVAPIASSVRPPSTTKPPARSSANHASAPRSTSSPPTASA